MKYILLTAVFISPAPVLLALDPTLPPLHILEIIKKKKNAALSGLTLSSILSLKNGRKKVAIMNQKQWNEGDTINGLLIRKINTRSVELIDGDKNVLELFMGDSQRSRTS